jgi:RNase P subunit RPR2
LRQINAKSGQPSEKGGMRKLIFRCVRTGMNVQIHLPDEDAHLDHADSYVTVTCPACAMIHLVNKTTGRLLSDKENVGRESVGRNEK